MRLAGKTALITGGNSGIGLATARVFVAQGARVAITGRDQATLDEAARLIGPDVLALRADILDQAATEQAVRSVVERFGQLDVVVANAGVAGTTPIGSTSAEQFGRILATNVTGVFLTVQAVAAHLAQGASVILIGSVHAKLGAPGYSAYAASKGGCGPGDGAGSGLGVVAGGGEGERRRSRCDAHADLVSDDAEPGCAGGAGAPDGAGGADGPDQRGRGDRQHDPFPGVR